MCIQGLQSQFVNKAVSMHNFVSNGLNGDLSRCFCLDRPYPVSAVVHPSTPSTASSSACSAQAHTSIAM